MNTIKASGLFQIAEELLLFESENYILILLVRKRKITTANTDSLWICFEPQWSSRRLSNCHYILQHWWIWWSVSFYSLGTQCVPGLLLYFSCLIRKWGLICIFKVTVYTWDVNTILIFASASSTTSLDASYSTLSTSYTHILCHILVQWNAHLFCCCGHHYRRHRYHTTWSGLMKGWCMGKVSQTL